MSNGSLQKGIESFLNNSKNENHLVFEHTLFVCRNDGLIIYFHSSNNLVNKNSVGALVGGLWQAGKTVVDLFGNQKSKDGFRLSFDTTDTGLHILPFDVKRTEYFMGLHFNRAVNPALVKNRMKTLMQRMKVEISQMSLEEVERATDNNLFNNITDEEINDLFSFAEN